MGILTRGCQALHLSDPKGCPVQKIFPFYLVLSLRHLGTASMASTGPRDLLRPRSCRPLREFAKITARIHLTLVSAARLPKQRQRCQRYGKFSVKYGASLMSFSMNRNQKLRQLSLFLPQTHRKLPLLLHLLLKSSLFPLRPLRPPPRPTLLRLKLQKRFRSLPKICTSGPLHSRLRSFGHRRHSVVLSSLSTCSSVPLSAVVCLIFIYLFLPFCPSPGSHIHSCFLLFFSLSASSCAH